MAKRLKNLTIEAVGLVDAGANQHAHITLAKRAVVKDGSIDDEENETPSSEGPCATCGGDHPTDGHAAAMASKKRKEPATKSVGTGDVTQQEAVVETTDVVKEKPSPADVRAARKDYEAVQKELEKARTDLQKQLDEANAELEESRAEVVKIHKQRRREQFIKRATELVHLPGAPADDFGEFLDDVEKALGEKRFAKFNNLLESWNTVLQKSTLFQELGRDGSQFGFSGPEGQLDALAKERVTKDADLQKLPAQVAYAKAYARVIETPEGRAIYKRHLAASRKES